MSWQEMFIVQHADNNNNIISYAKPTALQLPYKNISITRNNIDVDIEQVYNFIKNNNTIPAGNTLYWPKNIIEQVVNLKQHYSLLKVEQTLVGVVFCLILPIKVNFNIAKSSNNYNHLIDNDTKLVTDSTSSNNSYSNSNTKLVTDSNIIISGCTSYLCIHPKMRDKKLGMALIRDIIDFGYDNDIFTAYHLLSEPKTKNYTEINMWYRVIDLNEGPKYDHHYRNYNTNKSRQDMNKLRYTIHLKANISILAAKPNNYIDYIKIADKYANNKFVFYPNKVAWQQICQIFKVYLVKHEDEYVGCFMFNYNHMLVRSCNKEFLSTILIFCLGIQPLTLRCAVKQAQINKDIVLYCYEVGTVNRDHLDAINALECKNLAYLERYNQKGKLGFKDINVPLI